MKLLKYVVESGVLTLTFLLENAQELVVPIPSPTIINQMAVDLLDIIYFADGINPHVYKITRTIDPKDGAIRCSPDDEEYEGKSSRQTVPQDAEDLPIELED